MWNSLTERSPLLQYLRIVCLFRRIFIVYVCTNNKYKIWSVLFRHHLFQFFRVQVIPLSKMFAPSNLRCHFCESNFCLEFITPQLDSWLSAHVSVPSLLRIQVDFFLSPISTTNRKWHCLIKNDFNNSWQISEANRTFDTWILDVGLKKYDRTGFLYEQNRFLAYLGTCRWGTNNARKV